MKLTNLSTMNERKELLEKVAATFHERAQYYDERGHFPFKNFSELKEIGYHMLTIPKKYGGVGINLVELLKLQETIAKYDGSTALSIGWHMGITKYLGENDVWDEAIYKSFVDDVVEKGALINNAATEPAIGSPTRGGRPTTIAKELKDGWIINGRKSFTTLAPILDYFVVSASIDGSDRVGNFLVREKLTGVSIDETWDSVAMKATGSHDLVLENVHLKKTDLVQYVTKNRVAQGWLLHIPAVYLGLAKAAQKEAVQFATSYSPNSIENTISDFPSVRARIGEIKLLLLESETLLYSIAQKWERTDAKDRQIMQVELGAVKLSVVNKALQIVDLAMRIVGARSLSAQNPLQRYYRDVRAGLHNPPMDDMVIMSLAEESIKKHHKNIFLH